MEPLKAGYVSFGTQFYMPENLKKISARAEKQLTDKGIELVRTDPVFGEGKEPERAIEELKSQDWCNTGFAGVQGQTDTPLQPWRIYGRRYAYLPRGRCRINSVEIPP